MSVYILRWWTRFYVPEDKVSNKVGLPFNPCQLRYSWSWWPILILLIVVGFALSQPDQWPAMEYMNNASNNYGSGDAVSSSLANMTINEQHHQENGVAKMKGQTNNLWVPLKESTSGDLMRVCNPAQVLHVQHKHGARCVHLSYTSYKRVKSFRQEIFSVFRGKTTTKKKDFLQGGQLEQLLFQLSLTVK